MKSDHSAGHAKESFGRHLLRALPILVVVSVAVAFAEHAGWLQSFENPALDAFVASVAPRDSGHAFLVVIDDEAYNTVFQGQSPLDPDALRTLLKAVLAAQPAAVAVDIDTSTSRFSAWRDDEALRSVVWARDAVPADKGVVRMENVLGGPDAAGLRWGLALLPTDPDGLIRRYQRSFAVAGPTAGPSGQHITAPSLGVAAADTYCSSASKPACGGSRVAANDDSHDIRLLTFGGTRTRFKRLSATAVLASASQPWWTQSSPLKGRLVLVGGTYRAARDEYITPLGPLAGVELVAQAAEAEIGGGVRPVSHTIMLLVELLAGVLFVYLNWRFPPGNTLSLVVNSAATLVVVAVASYITFSAFSYWATFIPIGLSIRLHAAYDRFAHARADARELQSYRKRFGPLS